MSKLSRNEFKKELESLNVSKLKELCKERNLTYYSGKSLIKKSEMVEKILEFEDSVNKAFDDFETKKTLLEEKVENDKNIHVELSDEQKRENKERYIEQAEVGTLIAFYDNNGKPRTAKLVNRSSKLRKLKLVTEFDMEFVIPYEDVLWVKQNNRWPRYVYDILKERKYKNEEAKISK